MKCKKNCRKAQSMLSFSYQNRSKHEAGQSMCAAMNFLYHWHKLINFTMSLKWNMFIKCAHWAFYWTKYACTNLV